jgi:hypothetical protein
MSENSNAVATDNTSKTLARLVRAVKRQTESRPGLARNVAVFLIAVALLTAGFFAHGCIGRAPLVHPEIKEVKQDEKPKVEHVTPYQAQAKVGSPEEVTPSFAIQSAGKSATRTFRNDQRDYRSPGVMTVVVVKANVPGFEEPKALIGKTVTVKGHVTQWNGKPQIKVTDPSKISIK